MKRVIALFGLSALLVVALLWINQKRRQSPAYILTQYPQTQVGSLARSHLKNLMVFTEATKQVDVGNLIFFGTWFVNSDANLEMHQLVDKSGRTGISRIASVSPFTALQTENSTLTPAQLTALRAELKDLPPSQTQPAFGNLYILSFRADNGDWTTRIYDKSDLPPEIIALHKLAVTSKMAGTAIEGVDY